MIELLIFPSVVSVCTKFVCKLWAALLCITDYYAVQHSLKFLRVRKEPYCVVIRVKAIEYCSMQSCLILLVTRKIAEQCLLCLLLTKDRLHLTCCCPFQLSPTYRQPWNFSCKETLQHYYRPKVKISFTASNTAEFLERWVCNIYYISLSLDQYCRNLRQHFKCCHYRMYLRTPVKAEYD